MQDNPKQSAKGLIIFVAIALVVIAVGVAMFFMVIKPRTNSADQAKTGDQTVTDVQPNDQHKPEENKILIDDTNDRINVLEDETEATE